MYWLFVSQLLSLLTLFVYWWDKRQAFKGNWRVKEATLHGLALFGGWPGALIGREVFRHKTQKRPFYLILYAISGLHCVLTVLFLYIALDFGANGDNVLGFHFR
ncbi:DUF1294 domain-containing protein [Vibrio sp. S9_S30]|nr:DUF1294 domain-containing protein [Vibrio sp. S9_S30]MBD1558107.1 DUF1294 domain-containing protein [Vibrio sp. S9_S30]